MASLQTRLTVGGNRASLLDKIIAITVTSDASSAITDELYREREAQKEAMADLTSLFNMMLTQTPPPAGALVPEAGVEEITPPRNANLIPQGVNAGFAKNGQAHG